MNSSSVEVTGFDKKLYFTVTKIMHVLGISANLKGHAYIRKAAMLIMHDPHLRYELTTRLYPLLAKRFEVSAYSVERNIRTVIDKVWLVCDPDVLYDIFGGTINPNKGRPSNAEFLAMLADVINMELMK